MKDAFPLGKIDKYQGRLQTIHRLRELTAMPAVACKNALEANDWNLEEAFADLRLTFSKTQCMNPWHMDHQLEKFARKIQKS